MRRSGEPCGPVLWARGWVLLLLPIMLPSETPAPAPESEPEPEPALLVGHTMECLQGTGVEMLSASSLPAPTSGMSEAMVFPPGGHPRWHQAWLDSYLDRNPHLAGPTVYAPDLPPALAFDFTRSQPPDNETLRALVVDGTGISPSHVEVTRVEQTAVGQLRISGTVSDFEPGGEGYEAMLEFFTSLEGLCVPGGGCHGEILRVLPTHSADRIPDGGTESDGRATYFSTVDLEWKIHTPFDYAGHYRMPGFENLLMAINRRRGIQLGVVQLLGRSANPDPPWTPFVGQEADPDFPSSKALDGPDKAWRPRYPLPYYNTSFSFNVGVIQPCTPRLASAMMLERHDANSDLKISAAELVGLVQEINGTTWSLSFADSWLQRADSRYFNSRAARPLDATCTYTAEEIEQGCDNLLDFAELTEVLPGFLQAQARCVRKSSEDLFGNPKDEYMCAPWDHCGTFADPTKPPGSGATVEYKCGFGMCLPDFLHYGSGNVIVPDRGTFRCWDSCEQAEPIEHCEHFELAGFMLDTILEPLASDGRPLNLSAKVRSYAASCADEYDNTGYRSECEIMRCHYMGTALARVCDRTDVTLMPPCRSVCQAYIDRLSLPHSLPLYNSTSAANTPANFSDCDSILPVTDAVTGKLVGQWTYYHCLATMGQGCDNFPDVDCMEPEKLGGGHSCVLAKECESGGCPWAVPGLTSPDDQPVTMTGQDLAGHGGYCCAVGLGDCNGFGLCDNHTGACHCDEWHTGIDCIDWKMPSWLVRILVYCAASVVLGSMLWFCWWLRWYLVVHAKPKPPPPPKPEPIRKPARDSDTETEDEAETTDEETVDQQTSSLVTYDAEEQTTIWAKSRQRNKKPASADAVLAVAHYRASIQSHGSKDDEIGKPLYVSDAKGFPSTTTRMKPEPPPGPPVSPRTTRFTSGTNRNEEKFFSSPQDTLHMPTGLRSNRAEQMQSNMDRELPSAKLTEDLKQK